MVRGLYIHGDDGVCCLLADAHVGAVGYATYPAALSVGARFGRRLKKFGQRLSRSDAARSYARAAVAAASMATGISPSLRGGLRALSRHLPPGSGESVVIDPPTSADEVVRLLGRAANAVEEADDADDAAAEEEAA